MKSSSTSLLVAALALVSLGCRQPDPDPVELLRQTHAAVLATDTVAYDFRVTALGEQAAEVVAMTGTATIERTDFSGSGYLLHLEAEIEPPSEGPYRVVGIRQRDGTIYRYEPRTARAQYGSIYGVGSVLTGWMRPALMYPFFDPEALAGDIEAQTVVWEGADEVEGTSCQRVRVEFADDPERTEWCLGVDDHLPRSLAFIEGESGTRLEIFGVRAAVTSGADRFEFDPPAGIEVKPADFGPRPGSELPPWVFTTPAGDSLALTDLRGEALVLDFWATWCVPCHQSMVAIEELVRELVGEPVRFFAVNTMETAELAEVQRFLAERHLSSELLLEGDEAHLEVSLGNLPTAVVVDRQGRFVGMTLGYFGAGSEDYLEQLIRRALAAG